MDRAEAAGLGVATAGHLALLAALSFGFAATRLPATKSDPIEVAFVDEAELESATPDPSQEAPAPAAAFEPLPESATPVPTPLPPAPPAPQPPAIRAPAPTLAPRPLAGPKPPKPAAATTPASSTPARPKPALPRPAPATKGRERFNIDLNGARDGPGKAETKGAPAAVMNAQAAASVAGLVRRQVQPCADRMVSPGPGASRIKVQINLKLNRDGSLRARPGIEGTTGVDNDNRRYEQRVKEIAVAVFTACAPLRGLPQELYAVSRGWSDFYMNYNLP